MSMYAYDEGSRYLVKAENIDAAYKWLEDEGEYAYRVGVVKDCFILSANGHEDMFCGDVRYSVGEVIMEFMKLFCESGSYACHCIEEFHEYVLYWKDEDGVHEESRQVENPFTSKMLELES